MLQIYTGKPPFFQDRDIVVPSKVMAKKRPPRPDGQIIPDHLWDLIEVCWSQQSTVRPSMENAVKMMGGVATLVEFVHAPLCSLLTCLK
jgi:hypothetical protein